MGLQVNPKEDSKDSGGYCTAGRKLAHAVGHHRWTARTGTPMMTIGFVVLSDGNAGSADKGKVFTRMFAVTQKAIFFIARWADATGWGSVFNAESDDDIERIMAKGPVVAILEDEEYNGKTFAKVKEFVPYTGDVDPEWESMITSGEEAYQRIVAAQEEKRNLNENGRDVQRSAPTGGYGRHEDIPF